jgi:hypothetical protein
MSSSSIKESFGPQKMDHGAVIGIILGSVCGFFLILYILVYYFSTKK